ncbi:hypothetical protein [Nostoc sp. FACHB-892]|nr:hypothetical protein [Nostoc sp. FACHB-892]
MTPSVTLPQRSHGNWIHPVPNWGISYCKFLLHFSTVFFPELE